MQIINPSQAAVQGITLIASLKKMFMYTPEIEQELLGKSENFIVKNVYCQYQDQVINIVGETVSLLNRTIECIFLNTVIDISEITNMKTILKETGEQMRDVVFDAYCQYVDASEIMSVS